MKSYVETKFNDIQQTVAAKFQADFGVEVLNKLENDQRVILKNMKDLFQRETSRFVNKTRYEFYSIESYRNKMIISYQIKIVIHGRDVKIKLIRILPITWTKEQIHTEIGAPYHLIIEAKREQNEETSVTNKRKPGHQPLKKELEKLIKEFYEHEDNSRQLAGMRDFITIREPEGTRKI